MCAPSSVQCYVIPTPLSPLLDDCIPLHNSILSLYSFSSLTWYVAVANQQLHISGQDQAVSCLATARQVEVCSGYTEYSLLMKVFILVR